MKTFLAMLIGAVLLSDRASAIPQTFNPNGFQGAVGMPFEQYVATVAVWAPGAELKGPWKPHDGKAAKAKGLETLDLGVDATVFGIPAAHVSVERMAGVVRRFMVRFDETKQKNGKSAGGGLYNQVIANLTALAGEAKSVAPSGEKIFRHEATFITARKAGGKEVLVEFTPAR